MKEQILTWCRTLATSQGFYGRLLDEFEENPEYLDKLAENNFDDIIDFVLFIES